MPQAFGGVRIADGAQIANGILTNAHISATAGIVKTKLAALGIVDADVAANAAIAKTKLVGASLGIVNADIDAGAAIADSKLAQITTASKVSGAALTLLANIPGAAGDVPEANLTAAVKDFTTGVATRAGNTASGSQNIAHGLGVAPRFVEIFVHWSGYALSLGFYKVSGGVVACAYKANDATPGNSTTNVINIIETTNSQKATISVDATNITLTWTLAGAMAATNMNISWKAIK